MVIVIGLLIVSAISEFAIKQLVVARPIVNAPVVSEPIAVQEVTTIDEQIIKQLEQQVIVSELIRTLVQQPIIMDIVKQPIPKPIAEELIVNELIISALIGKLVAGGLAMVVKRFVVQLVAINELIVIGELVANVKILIITIIIKLVIITIKKLVNGTTMKQFIIARFVLNLLIEPRLVHPRLQQVSAIVAQVLLLSVGSIAKHIELKLLLKSKVVLRHQLQPINAIDKLLIPVIRLAFIARVLKLVPKLVRHRQQQVDAITIVIFLVAILVAERFVDVIVAKELLIAKLIGAIIAQLIAGEVVAISDIVAIASILVNPLRQLATANVKRFVMRLALTNSLVIIPKLGLELAGSIVNLICQRPLLKTENFAFRFFH